MKPASQGVNGRNSRPADDARQHARAGSAAADRVVPLRADTQALIDVSSYPAETEVPSFLRTCEVRQVWWQAC